MGQMVGSGFISIQNVDVKIWYMVPQSFQSTECGQPRGLGFNYLYSSSHKSNVKKRHMKRQFVNLNFRTLPLPYPVFQRNTSPTSNATFCLHLHRTCQIASSSLQVQYPFSSVLLAASHTFPCFINTKRSSFQSRCCLGLVRKV